MIATRVASQCPGLARLRISSGPAQCYGTIRIAGRILRVGATAVAPSMCLACRHVRLGDTDRLACESFPPGIPPPMLDGPADRRDSVPGDKGLRFEPVDDVPDDVLSEIMAIDRGSHLLPSVREP